MIKFTEDMQPEEEARKVLALCVMSEVRQGKINRVLLVNRAIRSYWAQRAKLVALNKVRQAPTNIKITTAPAIMALSATSFAQAQQSDPPAKPVEPTGQYSPRGSSGQLETDNAPEGETPNSMQAKPKGSDKDDHKPNK